MSQADVAALAPGDVVVYDRRDDIVVVEPSDEACRGRPVKSIAWTSTYGLATTLLDRQRYRVRDLSDLYHRPGAPGNCIRSVDSS